MTQCYDGANYQGLKVMRILPLVLMLFAWPALAQNSLSFVNDREGESVYASATSRNQINVVLRDFTPNEIAGAFRLSLNEFPTQKLCSFDINKRVQEKLLKLQPKFETYPGVIHYMRTFNEIDDVVAGLLLKAYEISNTQLVPKSEVLILPAKKVKDSALKVIANFEKQFLSQACLDEAYRSLYQELLKVDKTMRADHIEGLYAEAFKAKKISASVYKTLEQARMGQLESAPLTIRSYLQKKKSLRTQYPLRDPKEQSKFVSTKLDGTKLSRRQYLLQNYTDIQIMLMSGLVKKLRFNLEARSMNIVIHGKDGTTQTEILEPMERFRYSIKQLRKDMANLALNTFFNGRSPSYMDLMIASYEVGLIPATELEEVASIEEIWNPKKTFWEKASVWVRSFSTVATLVIPPPYGFVPALVVVAIELTSGANKQQTDDNSSLF